MTPPGPDEPDNNADRAEETDAERVSAAEGVEKSGSAESVEKSGSAESVEDTTHARYGDSGPRLSPALIATLVTIPVMVIVGFIVFAALRPGNSDSTPVDSYAAESSTPAECPKFLAALPQTFEGYGNKTISGTQASWPASKDGDPVIVRCGVSRPAELSPTSNLQVVNPVQWFITDSIEGSGQAFICVDHRPYVALWVPVNAGNGPITDVSAAIERTLPRGPLDFG
ncbi:DUF3515 domain-containing protein [Gordonia sputi]|uniref:DUF3515 domain-containing protein n=1 Tax=Gordonia sputi TaxID=36823 RepID=UPI0022709990|nr:DUF3515 family protein [Gordonia sputi]